MMEKLPGVNMSVGTPGSAVAEAAAERSRQGQPRDPVWQSVKNAGSAVGEAATNVANGLGRSWRGEEPYVSNTLGLNQGQVSAPPQQQPVGQQPTPDVTEPGLLQRTWNIGEQAIGEITGARQPETPQPSVAGGLPQQIEAERGNPLAGSLGESNLGKALRGSQPIPNWGPKENAEDGRSTGSDAPPQSNR